MKDIFTFGDKPQMDGSIPVLKNGLATVCPKSQMFGVEHPTLVGKQVFMRLNCSRNCPLLLCVERSLASDPSQKESGFVMSCASSPQFIQIAEPEKKSTLIK